MISLPSYHPVHLTWPTVWIWKQSLDQSSLYPYHLLLSPQRKSPISLQEDEMGMRIPSVWIMGDPHCVQH